MTGRLCPTCVFFSPQIGGPKAKGQCRRRAPTLHMEADGPRVLWPLVRADWWCGDHTEPEARAA